LLIPPTPTTQLRLSTRKCSAEYSPALAHLNPTTRTTNKPLNSARQSLHSLHFVTLSLRSVGKRCSAENNPRRRCSPLRSVCANYPTTQLRPTPAKAPIRRRLRKSNHAGSLSAFAHNQLDISTPKAPHSASFRLRNLSGAPAPDHKSHPTAHCKPSSTFAGRTRFIPRPLREYAPRSSMKRPATAPEGAERRINNPTVP